LLKNIKLEGIGLNDIFKKIRKEVEKATNGQQSPASYDKTTGEFFFAFPKTYKLISEKDIEPKARLRIITEPKDAKISFINGILFKNGAKYKLGRYKIKITHPKYLIKVLEIELEKDSILTVQLKKMATFKNIKTDLVWNGKSKFKHVFAIDFNDAAKKYIDLYLTPKGEFEKAEHYDQRKIDFVKKNKNNILNGWLGKQTIEKISYDAEIEQFTITLAGKDLPNLLTFNLPVPISEAKQFKQKVKNFNLFIKQQKNQLYVYGVQAKLYRHKYYMELSTKLKMNTEEILKAKKLKQKLQQALEKIYKMPYGEIIKLKNLSFVGLDSLKRLTQVSEILKKLNDFNPALKIDLSDAELFSVPKELKSLIGLKSPIYLNFSKNYLSNLPEWIGDIQSLTGLSLDRNKLKSMPDSIGQLYNLEYLNFCCNKLKSVPESIGQLINLKTLYLENNYLSYDEERKVKRLLPNTDIYGI
jgi:uncharacterized protein YfkK (UPF0435 family)